MAYPQHRSDLIEFELKPGGALTLIRVISGLDWFRSVGFQDYLTPMEAAKVLGVHRVTMYDWIASGLIHRYGHEQGETWLLWGEIYQFGLERKAWG
jgi:excisionase family DNA binding protein